MSTTEELPSIAACRNIEPRKLSGLIRGELDWIVMKALEKDRNRRYETANGLAADLRRYLDDEPVQACPPSAWYGLRKFARRNKAALVMMTIVAMALTLAVVGLAVSNALITAAYRGETVQRLLAVKNAGEATKKENEAKGNAAEAKRQQKIAEENELLARRRFYAAQMNLAHQAGDARHPARVLELLEGQRPRFDQEDLRGFEWYYLWRLCHGGRRFSIRAIKGQVNSLVFSPNGRTLATGGQRAALRLDGRMR